MPRLTLNELLTATATTYENFKLLRHRKQIGLAFGRGDAYASLSYLPVDTVGIMLVETLGQSYRSLTFTAQLVRLHFDAWGTCVAEADAHPDQEASFAVVDLVRDRDGAEAHMVGGAADLRVPEALVRSLMVEARGFTATRVNAVNVSRLMRFIRTTAAAHGIDLSAAFMPPPDSAEFRELMRPYKDVRDRAIIEAKNRNRRDLVTAKIGEKARAEFDRMTLGEGQMAQ